MNNKCINRYTVSLCFVVFGRIHYNGVIMGAIASKITNHTILYSTVFQTQVKKTSKLRVTGLCAGNSPGTGEFPAQMASNEENVSICWHHHATAPYGSCNWVRRLPHLSFTVRLSHYQWRGPFQVLILGDGVTFVHKQPQLNMAKCKLCTHFLGC